jgi:hypothetical protein
MISRRAKDQFRQPSLSADAAQSKRSINDNDLVVKIRQSISKIKSEKTENDIEEESVNDATINSSK